ncbi:MAG: flavoprotein [Candidatus Poribacteria bacterium]|nr:MAG: flavoprotein [Candidatus Poribacteria bacterium]
MRLTIISCSLHPFSRSAVMAQAAARFAKEQGIEPTLLDLREHPLPLCNGHDSGDRPEVQALRRIVESSDALLLALPIYNYDVNAAAKNLIELTGRAWREKVVGFLCAAGGRSSYMSVMSLANSLMLDFRCWVVPRFVYATGGDFGDDRTATMFIESPEILERIEELVRTTIRAARGLQNSS